MRRHDNCQNARTCHEAGYAEGFSDAEASIRPRFATPSDGTLMGDLAHAYELGGWIGVAALVESRLAEERATKPKGTTMTITTASTTHTNSEQWTGALVIDSLSRLWQLKDKWVCVTQELAGSPQTCAWSELVEHWGPIVGVSLDA